jgi:hypothetical protein
MSDMRRIAEMSVASYQAAIQQEVANFKQAQLAGDELEMVGAANKIASYRSAMQQIPRMLEEATNPAQPGPRVNRYGLTEEESEIAKLSGISDEQYLQNRQRLHGLRAAGLYPQKGQA